MAGTILLQRRRSVRIFFLAIILQPTIANSSVNYGYDALGRVTSALYDNGLCIAYTYDANGNRTSQVNSTQTAVWGSGAWGCFKWTP
ncbi:hypothetical protein EN836_26170 [Mesorhizobium sp. M1C.F.Ca.ET.193.01.1.1]|nr:hypothetical protein EN853_26160 [Mesorhizobium sp. M1C.F.Ca.ET.210.01.1.1]TGQ66462.1 hypothetical protein EN855_026170 [Mesorhizobium sp. M1C.F.Ca.ET.212.01.1.1]TGR00858.1 hypothetical protein EN847_26160 [Mesorhizobium sp. M1C.F.Ca.ET.204.01.1.1]TGR21133.1 hypothetical protein EN839_26160 [Mesorhizobium sp. M1C.F.Ca.ET.196.01.1.1]TGR44051.1 hypothetical protein EN838_26160 [Mesorhizobium sp. M1C.F.Ca.ET.195.01.1.1]TGR62005.1 hypothetical protein EN835_026155 [Mesorhizobium sp. M1C.F.Ca.ET